MSVIRRDCKVVKKKDCLHELFILKLVEAVYKAGKQLEAIRDMLVRKDPDFAENVRAMGGKLGQYTNNHHVRDGCLWMDERLVIPISLCRPIINRIHRYHRGKASIIDAAGDIWYSYIHRSVASAAEECAMCTAAGKKLKTLCQK